MGAPAAPTGRRVVGPRWRSLEGLPVGPLIAVLVLGAAMQLPSGLYDSLWSRMLTNRGASALLIGISLSVFGLPFIVLAPLGGRLAERRGPFLAAGLGLVGSDLFMAAYGFVPWPLLIVLLGVGEACVASVAIPGGFAAVGRVFPDDRMATGQGLFGGFGTIAAGSAAVIGAPVFAALGPGAAFAGGAAVSALLVGVAFLVWRSDGLGRRPVVAVASPSALAPVAGTETMMPAAGA
ncbi:MFS transporter, partial [Acidimicrobiaceae bacterium USS-CC1]|nr:MFS transporter [Acidiferrimicrobium australe]